jgi:hypothetical protein
MYLEELIYRANKIISDNVRVSLRVKVEVEGRGGLQNHQQKKIQIKFLAIRQRQANLARHSFESFASI